MAAMMQSNMEETSSCGLESNQSTPDLLFHVREPPLSMAEEEDMAEDEGVLAKTTGGVDAFFEEEETRFSV